MPKLASSNSATSEHRLVFAVASGDESSVKLLFDHYGDAVLRFVYRRVKENLEDAEEITLDTFVTALNLARSYDPRSSVLTWLCGIAKLRIVDYYRKKDRSKRIPAEMTQQLDQLHAGMASLEQTLDRIEASRMVDVMLADLNEDEREAILCRYVEQLSVRETALLMKRSEKGIESLLTRAKGKARGQIERWLPGGGL